MSDVKTRSQVGPVSNGLKLSAQPFIPQQAQAERPASTLTVTAAPFTFPTPATNTQGNGASLRPPGPAAATSRIPTKAAAAAPFVPSGAAVPSTANGGRSAPMSSSAPPFVPVASTASFTSPRGKAAGDAPVARAAVRGDLLLPDGDDLLGMTAHTPGSDGNAKAQPRSFQAQNGLDPTAIGAASESFVPAAAAAFGAQQAPNPTSPSRGAYGFNQGFAPSPGKAGRAGVGQTTASFGRGAPPQGRGRGGGMAPEGGRGRGRRGAPMMQGPQQPPGGMMGGPQQQQQQHQQQQMPVRGYPTELSKAAASAAYYAERLRPEEQQRSYLLHQQAGPLEAEWGLPDMVQHYHSLYPLEDLAAARERPSSAFGVATSLYKAVSAKDGQGYTLRRLDPRKVAPSAELLAAAAEVVQAWAGLGSHPNLVAPRAAFVTGELEGNAPALVFAHAFHPAAITLEQAHLLPSAGLGRAAAPSEEQLWSYAVQLASALRAAHSAGLLLRPAALAPSKILLTSPGRIRVGSLGAADVLAGEVGSREEQATLQREDLAAAGRALLALACAGAPPSLDYCAAGHSQALTRALSALLASPQGSALGSWQQVTAMLGEQLVAEVDRQQLAAEAAAMQVWRGAEDGRLMRVLTRLCFVLERPEADTDPQWAETGDRYLLKLFRDFVFHQSREDASPVLDWGHVVECLNKLDAGLPEKVTMVSRDEASMLVVSYADLKRCLEAAFSDLRTRESKSRLLQRMEGRRR